MLAICSTGGTAKLKDTADQQVGLREKLIASLGKRTRKNEGDKSHRLVRAVISIDCRARGPPLRNVHVVHGMC